MPNGEQMTAKPLTTMTEEEIEAATPEQLANHIVANAAAIEEENKALRKKVEYLSAVIVAAADGEFGKEAHELREGLEQLMLAPLRLFNDENDEDEYLRCSDVDAVLDRVAPVESTVQKEGDAYIQSTPERRQEIHKEAGKEIGALLTQLDLKTSNKPLIDTAACLLALSDMMPEDECDACGMVAGQHENFSCSLELTTTAPAEPCPRCGKPARLHRGYPRPGHVNYNANFHELKVLEAAGGNGMTQTYDALPLSKGSDD
jgi:hypothetical protein